MASRSKLLRDDYLDGYEIVVAGGPDNPDRPDGRHVVIYQPRSRNDKSPWVRLTGFPFRYHAGELKSVATRATMAYRACQHTADCPHTKAGQSATAAPTGRRYDPSLMAAYDAAEKALRAAGELDPLWYRM